MLTVSEKKAAIPHRSKQFVIALLIGICILPPAMSYDSLVDEIKAYNSGKFQQVIALGQAIVAKQKNNDLARYYLANAYFSLGLRHQAYVQYSICQNITANQQMKNYCQQALSMLTNKTIFVSLPSANGTSINRELSNLTENASLLRTNLKQQEEASQEISYLRQRESASITAQNELTNNEITDIKNREQDDINSIPTFIYNARGRPVRNPDYPFLRKAIEKDAERQINEVKAELARQQQSITQDYNQRENSLISSLTNISSQIIPGTDTIQLSPYGTNLYVHNYITYVSGSPPAPPRSNAPGSTSTSPEKVSNITNTKTSKSVHGKIIK